jgi:hypothetical protein
MTLAGEFGLLLILGEARGRELARESGESVDMNVPGLTLSRVGLLLILGKAHGRELARESGESVDINMSGLTLSRVGLLLILGKARGRELARESGESVDMNVSGLTLSRASSLPPGLHQAVGTASSPVPQDQRSCRASARAFKTGLSR